MNSGGKHKGLSFSSTEPWIVDWFPVMLTHRDIPQQNAIYTDFWRQLNKLNVINVEQTWFSMLRSQIKLAQCWWQFHFWQKGWILAMSLQHPSPTVEKQLSKTRSRTWLQLSCREPDDLQPQRLRSKTHLYFSLPFFIAILPFCQWQQLLSGFN